MTPEPKSAVSPAPTSVTRADIEAKLSEIRGSVGDGAERAKGVGIAVGVAVVTAAVVGAYLLGRRRGRKRRAVIEIQRV
ncbi:MAG TPA: hypothetical protein VI916_11945 [Acidimicrobiia bacterium]|nr:hypothetical protein [Acidimicrobiia bacterium]